MKTVSGEFIIKSAMGMYRVGILASAVLLVSVGQDAFAAEKVSTTKSQTTPTSSEQAPSDGTLKIKLKRLFHSGGKALTLRGRKVAVQGTVAPYVKDQHVVVRLYRGARKLRAVKVKVREDAGSGKGEFAVSLPASRTGRLVVRASHRGTSKQVTMVADPQSFTVLKTTLASGSKGLAVRLLQRKLAALHYAVPRSGRFDGGTARAVMAYRKVNGMRRTTNVNKRIMLRLLRGQGAFKVRFKKHGHHVEADLSRQVLALIDKGKVVRTYSTSSGSPATPTVIGHFRVYMKTPGTNAKGMVFSSYFIRGYAVHGYASVPPYPASHGCLRVPVPNAISIYNWIKLGDRVDVYR